MPEFKLKTSEVRDLDNALEVFLREDMGLLFSYRLTSIQEAIQPTMKGLKKTLKKLDEKFREEDDDGNPIPMKVGGRVIGNKVRKEDQDAAADEQEKILDRVVGFTCPDIPMKELMRVQDEDMVPVPGVVLGAFRPVLTTEGVDLTKAGEPKKDDEEKAKPKPRGRAAAKKAQAKAAEEE